MKGNSRVFLPRKVKSIEVESVMETIRVELKGVFKNYVENNCGKGGKQKENLSKGQSLGLQSLRKRVSDGNLVVIPTDKSGILPPT